MPNHCPGAISQVTGIKAMEIKSQNYPCILHNIIVFLENIREKNYQTDYEFKI